MATINLTELFAQNWGITPSGKPRITDFDGSRNFKTTNSGELQLNDENLVNKKSQTGKYGDYYKADKMGRHVFMPLTLGGLFLPYCWIAVKSSKRIIETTLTERRGLVRELIALNDYKFDVKGFVIGQNGTFPEKDIEDLRMLYERNEAIECSSVITDIFLLTKEQQGQDKVVMYDLQIAENQAIEHVRGYSFVLQADQQFELEIID